jgi:hypothetical protein
MAESEPQVPVVGRVPGSATAAPESGNGGATAVPLFSSIVAAGLLVAYFVFLVFQWNDVGAAEPRWSRRSDLFGGVEALAFAATGAILGATVQRQVTKKAEAQASQAHEQANIQKQRADANEAAAEKGRALHNLIAVKAKKGDGTPQIRGALPDAGRRDELQELLELARQYDAGEH